MYTYIWGEQTTSYVDPARPDAKSTLASRIASCSNTARCRLEPVFFVLIAPPLALAGRGADAGTERPVRMCAGTMMGVSRGGGGHCASALNQILD